MKIEKIKLENWRNHSKFDFEFNGITIFVGKNASGKTNFLEAIYYLSTGKSFRTKDENIVNWERDYSRLTSEICKKEGKEDLLVVLEKRNKVVKTVKIKGQKKPSSHLLGHLNSVIFTPEEIELISNLPEARRRYLNLIISQIDREYAYALIHYKRTLEQRNSLLKRIFEGFAKREELEVWDGKLAEFGSKIIAVRNRYINEINGLLDLKYELLSGKNEKLEVKYLPSIKDDWAGFITKLIENREKDILSRVTSVGPHRDDFAFTIDEKNVNDFASRGEFRTIILALKLAEVDFFEKMTGERPILLLDDVFSELDEARRDLLSQIFINQQTVVTTTDLDHISKNIIKIAKVVEMG